MRKTFKCTYSAFGSVLSDSGTFDNDYLYTSQAIDENDLYCMHARYYDNSIGRFTSTDPFPGYRGIPSTMHPYNYCGGNPVNFVDPMGLNPAPPLAATGSSSSSSGCWLPEGPPSHRTYSRSSFVFGPAYEDDLDPLFIDKKAEEQYKKNLGPYRKEKEFHESIPRPGPTIKEYITEAMSRKQWSISFTREALEQSSFPYAKGKVIDVFTGKVTRTVKDLGTAFGLGMDFSFGPQPLPGENYYEVYTALTLFGRFGGISFGFGQSDFFPFIDPSYGTFKTINVHLGLGLGLPFGGVHTYTE